MELLQAEQDRLLQMTSFHTIKRLETEHQALRGHWRTRPPTTPSHNSNPPPAASRFEEIIDDDEDGDDSILGTIQSPLGVDNRGTDDEDEGESTNLSRKLETVRQPEISGTPATYPGVLVRVCEKYATTIRVLRDVVIVVMLLVVVLRGYGQS